MKVSFPKTYGEPLYEVEYRANITGNGGRYCIDGKRVKRVSTIVERFPDTKEGLIDWSKERVAITAARLLKDRVKEHPGTGNRFCYFPAEQIDMIVDAAYRNPDEIKEETADCGTGVHDFCEEFLEAGGTEEARKQICANYMLPADVHLLEILQAQTETKDMTDTDRNLFYDKMRSYMFNRFAREWMKSGYTYLGSEIMVGSRKHGFGGRIDILARDRNDRLVQPDLKTTKHIAPKMFSQLALYKLAFEEQYGEKIHRSFIIHIPREWTERNQGWGVYSLPLASYKAIALSLIRYWPQTDFSAADCRKDCLI